jgi:methyltransferase (TIGR00027 family)
MFPDAVSRTSLLTAAARAAESKRDAPLVTDPFAEQLAGADGSILLKEHPQPDWLVAGLAIRTRFFDEAIVSATVHGAAQVLLIAAGLDTRAWRLALPAHVRWFEIDLPPVLHHKARALDGVSPRVQRVAVPFDLREGHLAEILKSVGFDSTATAVVVVEGLLMYLASNEVESLLTKLASVVPAGSALCADIPNAACIDPKSFMGPFLTWIAAREAPWRFGTDDPRSLLDRTGWAAEEILFAGHPRAWPERLGRPSFEHPPPGIPVTWMVRGSRARKG